MLRRLPYIVLVVLLLLVGGIETRSFLQIWETTIHPVNLARYPFGIAHVSDQVAWVQPEASDSGLQKDDHIIDVAGQPYTGAARLDRELQRLQAGDVLVLRAATDDDRPRLKSVSIRLRAAVVPTLSMRMATVMIRVITPVFCLLLGFVVAFLRPRDPLAWILLGMMVGFACLTPTDPGGWPDGVRQAGILFFENGVVCWPVFMLLFGIYFPDRLELDRRRPWLKWLLIAPLLALAVLNSAESLEASENFQAARGLALILARLGIVHGLLAMAGVSTFFTLLGYKKGTTKSADAQRRLHLLSSGAQVSLTPIGVLFCFLVFGHVPFDRMPVWVVIPSFLLLFVFPATLAYVIVVHRALDVRVVLRQSLQYALARGGVRVLQSAVVITMLLVAVRLADDPSVSRPAKLAYLAAGTALAVRIRSGADVLRRNE